MQLTEAEADWLEKMPHLLDSSPERFGFFTTGDLELAIFDRTNEHLIRPNHALRDEIERHGLAFGELRLKSGPPKT